MGCRMTKDSKTEVEEKHADPPNKQLASVIADALVSAGLTSASRKDALATRLATGQISAQDWRTEITTQIRESGLQQEAQS
jgi:hypothetical protein